MEIKATPKSRPNTGIKNIVRPLEAFNNVNNWIMYLFTFKTKSSKFVLYAAYWRQSEE